MRRDDANARSSATSFWWCLAFHSLCEISCADGRRRKRPGEIHATSSDNCRPKSSKSPCGSTIFVSPTSGSFGLVRKSWECGRLTIAVLRRPFALPKGVACRQEPRKRRAKSMACSVAAFRKHVSSWPNTTLSDVYVVFPRTICYPWNLQSSIQAVAG